MTAMRYHPLRQSHPKIQLSILHAREGNHGCNGASVMLKKLRCISHLEIEFIQIPLAYQKVGARRGVSHPFPISSLPLFP